MISGSTATPFEYEQFIILIWLFIILITVLMLFLCYLYLSMRRSLQRENDSLSFSHLAIEGIEIERRRVSRELHDVVLPLLKETEVSDLIRGICMELTPPDFSRLSLKESLADLCQKFTKRSNINFSYKIDDDSSFTGLGSENQLHLYRMVQESLTNIEKHSKAGEAVLVVRRHVRDSTGFILVCVSDDGIGLTRPGDIDAPAERKETFGMRSLKQRAAIIGAELDFISESGNGLMVRILVPEGQN
ncbi:MAG: histidine kinase [Treponema sp.]|nr:histidine kinase [Treponema sp.]